MKQAKSLWYNFRNLLRAGYFYKNTHVHHDATCRLTCFFNSKKRLRNITIWLIPVILIPALWPLYSLAAGQADLWLQGIIWQTGRGKPLLSISVTNFLQIDPLTTVIGIAGFIWTGLRKDLFPLVWVVPFLIFSYFIGWVQYFHLIVIFPAFCIATAVLIYRLQRLIARHNFSPAISRAIHYHNSVWISNFDNTYYI